MIKRIVTYDIKEGHDYLGFYDFVERFDGQELTESTYEFNTNLSQDVFERKLANAFTHGDLVYFISVDKDTHKLFYKKVVI